MPLKTFRPMTPALRFKSVSSFEEITKSTPEKSLLEPKKSSGGRNNKGQISVWHRGGGHKRMLRKLDFKREKYGIPAKVAAIEYDPNRSARIALLHYVDGEKRYILAPLEIHVGDIFANHDFMASPVEDASGDRSRPNLKIQDGCNNRCSFCIIPFVRGRSRSMPAGEVTAQVRTLSANYPEVVLSGINLGRWGREPGHTMRLAALVKQLLDETPIQRLRLSSIEPMDWSDDLLALVAETPRIAKHIHAPLQSGSDTVLRRMHRKYRPRHYEDRIRKARASMPDAAIGADVMVGFPGETDVEFEQSRQFIDSLPFTYLHVFTYSQRPGTPAAENQAQVPMPVRKERNRILRELASRKHAAFLQSMVGRELTAVTLDGGSALSDNFLKVKLVNPAQSRQIKKLFIAAAELDHLIEKS